MWDSTGGGERCRRTLCVFALIGSAVWSQDSQSPAALNDEAILHHDQRRYADAERLYKRAIDIWARTDGRHSIELLRCTNNLGALYVDSGQFGKAERHIGNALVIDPSHPEFARLLQTLAAAYYGQRRYEEAEPLYRRALAIAEGSAGPDNPDLASLLNNLGNVCTKTGRLPEAQGYLGRARRLLEIAGNADPLALAPVLINLATATSLAGRHAESETLLEQALAMTEAKYGDAHPLIADILVNRATVLRKLGLKKQAKPLEERAKAIRAQWEDPVRHSIDIHDLRVADALR